MSANNQASFSLGKWLVDPDRCCILYNEEVVALEPKSMDVLLLLAQRQGEVVYTSDIIATVWHNRPMGDNPVYKCIAKLRKALAEEAKYIVTVPTKGYRLALPTNQVQIEVARKAPFSRAALITKPISLVICGIVVGLTITLLFISPKSTEPLQPKIFSTFPGSHSSASFSADGERVVFVNDSDGKSQLYVTTIDSPKPRQLTFGQFRDERPKWSPVNNQVLFGRENNLWIYNLDSGQETQLIRNAKNASWSHDGKKIVFERRFQLWTANADGGNQFRVEGPPDKNNLLSPRIPKFSPDGKSIAFFQSYDTPLGDLWLVPSKGGEARRLTHSPSLAGGPIWTPDGRALIYSAQRGDSRTLWKVTLKDGMAVPLLAGSGDDVSPEISADGNKLIYTNSRNRFILTITDFNSGVQRDIFETRHILLAPELSPDNSQIAFFTYAPIGGLQIFTVPFQGGTPQMITREPQSNNAIPQWSADGNHIYYYQTGAASNFRKVGAMGGPSSIVASAWQWDTHNAARVSPNEEKIVYSSMNGGVPVATLIHTIKTMKESTFHATLEWPRWSRDGLRMLGALFEEQRTFGDIAVCHVEIAKCEILANGAHIPIWSEDEEQVYFVREDGDHEDLWSVPVNGTGKEVHLARLGPLLQTGPFYDVNPNQEVVWVRFEKGRNELWIADIAK